MPAPCRTTKPSSWRSCVCQLLHCISACCSGARAQFSHSAGTAWAHPAPPLTLRRHHMLGHCLATCAMTADDSRQDYGSHATALTPASGSAAQTHGTTDSPPHTHMIGRATRRCSSKHHSVCCGQGCSVRFPHTIPAAQAAGSGPEAGGGVNFWAVLGNYLNAVFHSESCDQTQVQGVPPDHCAPETLCFRDTVPVSGCQCNVSGHRCRGSRHRWLQRGPHFVRLWTRPSTSVLSALGRVKIRIFDPR